MMEIDPQTITDLDGAREAIRRLLNLVETLSADLRATQEENQRLRDEINRLKGEQGKPDIKPNRQPSSESSPNLSSESERRVPRGRVKRAKNDSITIDREVTLEVAPTTLPSDAERKGYDEVIVQDVVFRTDNVRFRKAKWYSPSEQQTYLAPLPPGYEGQFGPTIKVLVLVWYFACQMSEGKIVELLRAVGTQISEGQVSNLIIKDQDSLHAEKTAIVEAGLATSPWQQTDDTATRVNGHNQHCHVLSTPLYTAYTTKPKKDRLTVLDVLLNGHPRSFLVNDDSLTTLVQRGISTTILDGVRSMPHEATVDEATFTQWLQEHVPKAGPQQAQWIREATAVAAYHAQQEVPVVDLLVCDDAPQFKHLTEQVALCWVHDGRHYKKLMPQVPCHQSLLQDFRQQYWDYYHALRVYRESPTPEERNRLQAQFDDLFSTVTGYDALDDRIAKTRAKKASLLLVLDHPEIPLHNNAAELGCRARVRKRDVSFGARTEDGVRMWDTGMTLVETAKKLGVSCYHYLQDRLSGAMQMPSLAHLITERAQTLNLGASWSKAEPSPDY
jgi:hypothetical protein